MKSAGSRLFSRQKMYFLWYESSIMVTAACMSIYRCIHCIRSSLVQQIAAMVLKQTEQVVPGQALIIRAIINGPLKIIGQPDQTVRIRDYDLFHIGCGRHLGKPNHPAAIGPD